MAPRYHEIDAKSITRLAGVVDPWFLARYGMNLYRGCEHGCRYCDGRAERYRVEGDFARDIQVKRNAVPLLRRELERIREPGFVMLGGGVSDAYQPADASFRLARGALEVALDRGLPVHVLTKSSLVERDFDLLQELQRDAGAILSFSIQSVDDDVRARTEPGAAPVAERWRLLKRARDRGIHTGVMAMPVLPGISDMAPAISELVSRAADVGVDFLLHGGLTLRPGVLRRDWLELVRRQYPEHLPGYERVFRVARDSGAADPRYYARVDARFRETLSHHGLAGRPPHRLFRGRIPRYADVAVRLEHRAYEGSAGRGPGRAAHALQRWARRCFTLNRRRSYSHRDVEAEFALRLADETLPEAAGIAPSLLPLLRRLDATC